MTKYHKKRYFYFRVLHTYLALFSCLIAFEGCDNAGNQSDPQIPDAGSGVEEKEEKWDSGESNRRITPPAKSAATANGPKNTTKPTTKRASLGAESLKSEGSEARHLEEENKVLPKAIRLEKATVSLAEENEDSYLLELTFVCNKPSIEDDLYILPKGTTITLKYAEEEVLTIEIATDQQLVNLNSGPDYGFTHQVFIKKHELNTGPDSEGNLLIDLLQANNPIEDIKEKVALTGMWSRINFNLLNLKFGKPEKHQFDSAPKAEYITKLLQLKKDVNSLDGLPQAGILHLFYLMQSVGVNVIVEMPTGEQVESTSPKIEFKWLK